MTLNRAGQKDRRLRERLRCRRVRIPGSVVHVAPSGSATTFISAALTAYRGEQPKGFSIEKIPTGGDVVAAGAGKLVLAKRGDH